MVSLIVLKCEGLSHLQLTILFVFKCLGFLIVGHPPAAMPKMMRHCNYLLLCYKKYSQNWTLEVHSLARVKNSPPRFLPRKKFYPVLQQIVQTYVSQASLDHLLHLPQKI